jgi:uncharacterized protein DUF6551
MPETTIRKLRPIVAKDVPGGGLPGPRSELQWIALEKLVVDDRYQRSIGDRGRENVMRILANFEWSKFAPVVVTPVEDGRFAIIDGQHRATAALMHHLINEVPCMIVNVTPEEAAACFAAINGQVTAITKGQIHHARVQAGDPVAVGLQEALDAAGVRILKYKVPNNPYRVGETLAIGTLERCFKTYGRDTLITALQSVTMSGSGNPGCLMAPIIQSLCELLHEVGAWRDAGTKLLAAMDEINLIDFIAECGGEAKRNRLPVAQVMKRRLASHLLAVLGRERAIEAVA